MKNIVVLSASNSKKSINKELAVYASSFIIGVQINVLDLNNYALPIYGIDIELEQGIHPEAKKFSEDISKADAYIIALAEHNGSYSAAFKNAYDWASRVEQKVWGNKPVLLLATSPGARGGATVLEAAKASFPYMGAIVTGALVVPSFYDNFKNGEIINEELLNAIKLEALRLKEAIKE